jgi:hypothetical protein
VITDAAACFAVLVGAVHPLLLLQVEKAPVVIKTGVSKADAEAMQKQLEAGETMCTV